MRVLIAAVGLAFLASMPKAIQDSHSHRNPGSMCGSQSPGLPDFYGEALLTYIEPPDWRHSLVRIAVGGSVKIDLWTDGERFELLTNTVKPNNVNKFLLALDQSCRLPADPADAARMVNAKWESTDLTPAEFSRLHRDFADAVSRYIENAQGRYDSMMQTKTTSIHLDSTIFPIVYDNGYEHMELGVWNDPERKQNVTMLEWVIKLKHLAEDKFHRPIWDNAAE